MEKSLSHQKVILSVPEKSARRRSNSGFRIGRRFPNNLAQPWGSFPVIQEARGALKLKITIDPTGRMTAAYGKQRQSHTFTKANKTGTCRHVEILATMAVHGAWQPSRSHSEADRKAFKRLQTELQALLPLPGDPFRKEGAQFHPLFELTLPKEHWRDSSEDDEPGSEKD